MVKITKKPNESAGALVRRFSQQVHRSGVLTEVRSRKYREKPKSKTQTKKAVIAKVKRRETYNKLKRMGKIQSTR